MTEIIDTDGTGRIYQINNLLTDAEVADVMSTDWLALPWRRGEMQEKWKRRRLTGDRAAVLSGYVNNKLALINQLANKDFKSIDTYWWIDEPGFTVPMHTDGHLSYTMQLYWEVPGEEYGTVFYYYNNVNQVRFRALSVPNHGYLMDNHCENNYQLLHWHAMLNTVPDGKIRVSSYSIFN